MEFNNYVESVWRTLERKLKHVDDSTKHFNWIKHNIMFGLVGYERNKDWLMKAPHRRCLDLDMEVVYFYMVDLSEGLYFKVTNEHMDAWNVNESILYETAKHYTVKMFPALFRSIEKCILDNILYCLNNGELTRKELPQILSSCLKKSPEEISLPKGEDISMEELENCIIQLFDEAVSSNNSNMYVLSNGAFGAVCILYKNCLETIAESMGSDLYILPSSVRDMVIIPVDKVTDINVLRKMLLDSNRNIINADDVLTDSIYVYRREDGSIEIV